MQTVTAVPANPVASCAPIDPGAEQRFLRLNLSSHSQATTGLEVTGDGLHVVTASLDKTLKVWRSDTGELVETLRIPMSRGRSGQVLALALSPAKNLRDTVIAAGGYTPCNPYETRAGQFQGVVYLLSATGGILGTLEVGSADIITAIAFSVDGKWLAVGSSGTDPVVKVYDTSSWRPVWTFSGDGLGDVRGIDFSLSGQLAFSSYASEDSPGRVFLFTQVGPGSFAKTLELVTPQGDKPHQVAFSPTGRQLAVGFIDAGVGVYSAGGRPELVTASTGELKVGREDGDSRGLSSVAWSANGRYLFGAGTAFFDNGAPEDGFQVVRRWPSNALFERADVFLGTNTITGLTVADRQVYATDAFGEIIRFSETLSSLSGERLVARAYRDMRAAGGCLIDDKCIDLEVSPDGRSILLREVPGSSDGTLLFNVDDRTALSVSQGEVALQRPRRVTEAGGFLGIGDAGEPILYSRLPNTMARALSTTTAEDRNITRSYAFSHDDRFVAVGSDYSLSFYEADTGARRWVRQAEAPVYRVNIPAAGQFVIVAYGNGVVTWHRINDGRPLVSLFVEPTGRNGRVGLTPRWIAWAGGPFSRALSTQYVAGPGSDNLAGWHVNGLVETSFFPSSRFRSEYWDDALFEKVFDQRTEGARLLAVEAPPLRPAAPPTVHIRDARFLDERQEAVVLEYDVLSNSGEPITALTFFVDGQRFEAPVAAEVTRRDQFLEPVNLNAANPHLSFPPLFVEGGLRHEAQVSPGGVTRLTGQLILNAPALVPKIIAVAKTSSAESRPEEAEIVSAEGERIPERRAARNLTRGLLGSRPVLSALVVGIGKYDDRAFEAIPATENDAREFAAMLTELDSSGRAAFDEISVTTLIGSEATKAKIESALGDLAERASAGSAVLLYLAGHSVAGVSNSFVFVPVDASAERISRTGISQASFLDVFAERKRENFVFLDTAHVDAPGGGEVAEIDLIVSTLGEFGYQASVFAATSGNSIASPPRRDSRHSLFYEAIAGGLERGLADGNAGGTEDGKINDVELGIFIETQILPKTRASQRPSFTRGSATKDGGIKPPDIDMAEAPKP